MEEDQDKVASDESVDREIVIRFSECDVAIETSPANSTARDGALEASRGARISEAWPEMDRDPDELF